MGADNFKTTAVAPTARKAFALAVKEAQYEYGHGGYTGSIAEKDSFVLFQLPPRMTASKFEGLLYEASEARELDYQKEDLAYAQRDLARATTPAQRKMARQRIKEAQKWLKVAERRQARFMKKAGENAYLIMEAAQLYDDKWGCAVAVQLRGAEATAARKWRGLKRGNAYCFMGLASS